MCSPIGGLNFLPALSCNLSPDGLEASPLLARLVRHDEAAPVVRVPEVRAALGTVAEARLL